MEQSLQFTIRLPPQSSEPVEGSGQRGARRGVPLERHFDFEDLFEQLRRNPFGAVVGGLDAFLLQDVLGAGDRVAQGPEGVVQNGRGVQGEAFLVGGATREMIGMHQAAQAVVAPLKVGQIDAEPAVQFEEAVVVLRGGLERVAETAEQRVVRFLAASPASFGVHQAEKEVPQPQLFLALGFSKTNPDCMSDSL